MNRSNTTSVIILFLLLSVVIVSYGGKGCLWWAEDDELTITGSSSPAMSAPFNLTVTPTGTTSTDCKIDLTWTDNSDDEDGFSIERRVWTSGTYVQVATVVSNTISYTHAVSRATTYYYKILAYKGSISSIYSNEASAITPVDNTGNVGQHTSMAIDSTGLVHIAYYDLSTAHLNYATISPTITGSIVMTETADTDGTVGLYSSIALDTNNKPYISYWDAGNDDLKCVSNTTGTWIDGRVYGITTTAGKYSSIARGSGNTFYISFHNMEVFDGDLYYATNGSGKWVSTVIDEVMGPPTDTDVTGWHTSIAVDDINTRHISYHSDETGSLRYAYGSVTTTIDSGVGGTITDPTYALVGLYSAIALDSNNYAHISYYDATNGNLKYGKKWPGGETVALIDSAGDVGQYTSIAVDTNDKMHISYYDADNRDLKYATDASGSWVITTMVSTGDVGKYTSLAVDANNTVHITYYDETNKDLKYWTNK